MFRSGRILSIQPYGSPICRVAYWKTVDSARALLGGGVRVRLLPIKIKGSDTLAAAVSARALFGHPAEQHLHRKLDELERRDTLQRAPFLHLGLHKVVLVFELQGGQGP